MRNSLLISTVEEFAENAGIPKKVGTVKFGEDKFTVTTESGEYIAQFSRNGQQISYFSSPTLGRDLTREEARDVMGIIGQSIPFNQRDLYAPILTRLNHNLPNLGFRKDTPLWSAHANCDGWN